MKYKVGDRIHAELPGGDNFDGTIVGLRPYSLPEYLVDIDRCANNPVLYPATIADVFFAPEGSTQPNWRVLLEEVMQEIAQFNDLSITKVGKRPNWIKATEARTKHPI